MWVNHTSNSVGQMLWYVDNNRELYVNNGSKYRFHSRAKRHKTLVMLTHRV